VIDQPVGTLYLGENIDGAHQRTGSPVLLPSADLTTHGVIVGMTGSGKTGLGIALIEEALLAGIPTLVLDPKGDLTNLLLTFPSLSAEEFAPWVEGSDPAAVAQQWKDGLADWGIEAARVQALRDAAAFTVYTPGSTAGVPLNIVGSLEPPAAGVDPELVNDEVEAFVSGVLGLVGVDADPLSSREAILLTNLIHAAWANGQSLDLASLVAQVQQPPIRKLGVFELDAFFPPSDRTALAMKLNGLLASPSFAAWAQGPDLDPASLLFDPSGKPACAIVELAHLSDEERQLAVTLVLSKLVSWMRTQPGSTSLRALVYFDEVMGFVPPIGAPPAKKPILTILKQARAFGVGMVLATQNPVDVDYKALSNAGTWMVGRLQTEQDKARLLDGMSAASGGVDVRAMSDTISGLGKREFVLRRAGKDAPEPFTSRWAMSYLRGPLTRTQISALMADRRPAPPAPPPAPAVTASTTATAATATTSATGAASRATTSSATASPATTDDSVAVAPKVADGVAVRWVAPDAPWISRVGGAPGSTRLAAALVARASLTYDETRADLRHTEEFEAVLLPVPEQADASALVAVDYDPRDLLLAPAGEVTYVMPNAPIATKTWFTTVQRAIVDHLVASRSITVQRNASLKLWSRPGETKELFAQRCEAAADDEAAKLARTLQAKYQDRIVRAQQAVDAAVDRVAETRSIESNRQVQEAVGVGSSLLGALFGRKSVRSIGRAVGTSANRRGQSATASRRVDTARGRVDDKREALEDLEADLADELRDIADECDQKALDIEDVDIPLEKTDVRVTELVLAWVPVP
jgi:hypothetical protein